MRRLTTLLSTFFFLFVISTNARAAGVTAVDVNCDLPCINSYEIEDGAVGSADITDGAITGTDIQDGSVDTADITDGAVTDAKITGPVSATKIEQGSGSTLDADTLDGVDSSGFASSTHNHDAIYSKKYANVIVVDAGGNGDFTSIQTAIDSITPDSTNRYLVKVMPGTYDESVQTKSYMRLEGSGADLTKTWDVSIWNTTESTVSGLTIDGGVDANKSVDGVISENLITGSTFGIIAYYAGTDLLIKDNTITGNSYGMYIETFPNILVTGNLITGNGNNCEEDGILMDWEGSSVTVENNTITNNGTGIDAYSGGDYVIRNNVISNNLCDGISHGITDSETVIEGNVIEGNGRWGISFEDGSSPKATNNQITGNATADVNVNGSTPNVSFNVYDTVTGTPSGAYNVKSDGTAW